jgi:peptide/nickel transport system substrate-binding protein
MLSNRRTFVFGSLAAGLAGCTKVSGGGASSHGNTFTTPGTLRFSDGEDIAGLNSHLVPQLSVAQLAQLTGGFLIRFDDSWQPYPDLLERIPSKANGDISADGLEITYRLKDHLLWSDGAPLTADDIVFSFQAVNNPKNNEWSRTGFEQVVDAARRDLRTATIKLKAPYGPFWETYFSSSNLPLLPKHILGGLPDFNKAPFNALPIGAGPFKFESWKRNDSVHMVANEKFWRGRPKLDRIVYKIIPDWNTVATQIETGELDLAWLVPSSLVDRIGAANGFRKIGQPGSVRYQLQFNLSHPALSDVRVRRALRLAADRKALLEKVERGHGYLDESLIGPQSRYALLIPPLPYDPKGAAALLDQAGWTPGSDGVRAKNGTKLELEIATITGSPERDNWALLIQTWWQAVGVKVAIKHYPPSVLFASYPEGGIYDTGKYDVGMSGQSYGYSGGLDGILACNQFPPGGFNTVRYCNPALDSLMQQFNRTYDPAEAKTLAAKIQRTVEAEVPIATLFIPQDNYVLNSDVKEFGTVANLDDAYKWSI